MHQRLVYEQVVLAAVLSSGSVSSLTSITTSPSKTTSVKKARSVHSPASFYRPSSAETSSRGVRRASKTPQSPLHRSIHPSIDTVTRDEWLPVSLDVVPGGPDWKYYSKPVPENLAKGMVHKWPSIEQTFVKTLQQVFQILRGERECICQYFFTRR